MRLKSLQLKGFKSFANDTLLNFSEDIIGVVGPNGSGKSNIVDAIRWVLGEQKSKELRLESMSDIIFNGTKTRRPAASATVALTFDNDKNILPTEYQTVTISRTLYRSGESEYRINNVVCRLKDINSLFLDTGIGSNSYAIIALDMVDDMLTDKGGSRRKMFEQAAGVSKYKIRKKETLSKLKSAGEDLDRINDLLYEIDGNLKTLEKQAKRARKYLELREQYKELSIEHAVFSIKTLKDGYKGVSEQLLTLQDKYRANDVSLLKHHAKLEEAKRQNTEREVTLSDHQKKLNSLVSSIRNHESEKELLNQKLGFKKQNKENISKAIDENVILLNENSTAHNTLEVRISDEKDTLEQISEYRQLSQDILEKIKGEYDTAKMSLDAKNKEKQELEHNLFDLEKEVAIISNTIENHKNNILRLIESQKSKSQENQNILKEIEQLKSDLKLRYDELNVIIQNEEERKLIISNYEKERDTLKETLSDISRKSDSAQNEHDLLKDMLEKYEGFPESIKFLSEELSRKPDILSDIIDVRDKYKHSVELYLENYLNYFIVQDLKEARTAINLLKNAQKGKANFFLLDQIPDKRRESKEFVGLIRAIDIVSCPAEYQKLLDHLLAEVYIYDGDIEQITHDISDITVILESGTLMRRKYSVAGGSVGLFEGKKIGRKKNVEKLAKAIEVYSRQIDEMTEQLKSYQKRLVELKTQNNQHLIDKHRKTIQSLEQNRSVLEHQATTFNQLKSENEVKIKSSETQISAAEHKAQDFKTQIVDLMKRLEELEIPEKSNSDIDTLSDRMSAASEKFNNDNIAYIKQQNRIENLYKDKEFKALKISELDLKINNDRQRLLSEDRERVNIEDELIKIDNELKTLYLSKQNFQSDLSDAEQSFVKAKNEIVEIEDTVRNLTKEQSSLQNTIQNLKDQFTEQKFKIQSIGERLRIEFNISVNDVINREVNKNLDFSEMEANLEKLKIRLHSYGDVNPLAVEAYDELKERHDFIVKQRQDILDAQESLTDTIKEIEKTATEHFMDSFNKVRDNFVIVFRSLFTEDDNCDLILLDPDDPLESDIEIIAKPKGKRPRSISQLSGGEKTLTATALLFALYLLKPAPFCIFDEIDAPLDDSNITKFNKIIRNFSNESQFIIVTHNKSTMAEVNILYGIYMPEMGVSAVSPVDFRSLKHEQIIEGLN